jgi:hypothetical protein
MPHANFDVVIDSQNRLVIRDLGPWHKHPTVTNDAEWVVEQLAARLNGRVLLYFDSEGDLGRLIVKDGKFAAFAPWTAEL